MYNFGSSWFVRYFPYSGPSVTPKWFFWLWSWGHCIVFAWILPWKQGTVCGNRWITIWTNTFQYGVPQGSVLGPVLFTVYAGTLVFLLEAHEVSITFFADDTQLYIRVEDIDKAKHWLSSLLSDLKIWMARRKLKLNDGKTEIIVIRGKLRNVSVANFDVMSFGDTQLVPCESAKNLGVVLDSSLSFRSHRDYIVKTCNFHICNLYMIKDFVNRKNLVTLVHSLIVSKVDYCNSLFIGLPNVILKRVQSVLNRAARLIFNLPPRVPTTSSLIELHWLPLKVRIEFKICLITFKALKFNQPSYIRELLSFPPMNVPRVCEVQMTLTVYMNLQLLERGDLPIVLFLTLPRVYIINCQLQLNRSTP